MTVSWTRSLLSAFMLTVISVPSHAQDRDERESIELRTERSNDRNIRLNTARATMRGIRSSTDSPDGSDSPRIVNGDEVSLADFDKWGWMVSIRKGDRHTCGGSFVSPGFDDPQNPSSVVDWRPDGTELRYVVTAAHCFTKKVDDEIVALTQDELDTFVQERRNNVHFGDRMIGGSGMIQRAITKIILHPDYETATNKHDVAMMLIDERAEGVTETPVIPPAPLRIPFDGELVWLYAPYTALDIAGWGRIAAGGAISDWLLKVRVPMTERADCTTALASFGIPSSSVSESAFCAGYSTGGYDSCQGDSGGPVVFVPSGIAGARQSLNPILVGVVSWGRGCAYANAYGVYTNISHYRGWLAEAALELHGSE